MALLVVVLAVIPAIILIIGAHDREQREIERFEKIAAGEASLSVRE